MTLKLTRLSPALGAQVHDVDLSQPVSEALLAELRATSSADIAAASTAAARAVLPGIQTDASRS